MPGKKKQKAGQKKVLLNIIDQAFDKRSWHGTNLRGSLRNVTHKEALWRPSPKHHNIWEIVLHAAYWKYALWRKFTGSKKASYPRQGSDWQKLPKPADEKSWKKDIALLKDYHFKLRDIISQLPENSLFEIPAGSKSTFLFQITGIAAHDLYHAGQIQLIKRLIRGGAIKKH